MDTIRTVELFAGVGGFVLGLKRHPIDLKSYGLINGSLP